MPLRIIGGVLLLYSNFKGKIGGKIGGVFFMMGLRDIIDGLLFFL